MVLTSCPSAITASVVQDLTALPSRCTTHAPHCEVSHPTWVPVSRRFSRRNCTSSVRGSTFPVTALPFTVMETAGMTLLLTAGPVTLIFASECNSRGDQGRNLYDFAPIRQF